jgi:hypothetical protein
MIKYISLAIFSLVLCKCTVPVNYYLRNLTNETQKIILIHTSIDDSTNFEFAYKEEIFRLRHNSYKNFDKKLNITSYNNLLELHIPSNSTLHIGFGVNFQHFFEKMIIESKNDTIDFYNTDKLKIKNQFIATYTVWYDIEK